MLKDYLDPVAIIDTEATVIERFGYDAFGPVQFMAADFTPRTTSQAGWNFLFHAEFLDVDSGLYNYGYRYYDPQLGRWLSRDPIGVKGGVNLYSFVVNDGVNWVDLLGNVGAATVPLSDGSYVNCWTGQISKPDYKASSSLKRANKVFDQLIKNMFDESKATTQHYFFENNHPWTREISKKPVYDRLRDRVKQEMRSQCAKKCCGYFSGKWDDSADDSPPWQFATDGFNYLLGYELKSTGSVKGTFIAYSECNGKALLIVRLRDELRAGSMLRIPGFVPFIGDMELADDDALNMVKIVWEWHETVNF